MIEKVNLGRSTNILLSILTLLLIIDAGILAQEYSQDKPFIAKLETDEIGSWLRNAPMMGTPAARSKIIVLELPLPGGGSLDVKVFESPIIADPSSSPEIRTYAIQGVEDGTITGRLMVSPRGIDATILTKDGDVFIEPTSFGSELHKIYYFDHESVPHPKDDRRFPDGYIHRHSLSDSVHQHDKKRSEFGALAAFNIGTQLRRFRMHVIVDGEYSIAVDGPTPTRTNVYAAIAAAINSMNAFYVRDMAMQLVLLSEANTTIYLDPNTDPFAAVGGNDPEWDCESLGHHQTINNGDPDGGGANVQVTTNSYDVGHLFSGRINGGGAAGVAYLGVVCSDTPINCGAFTGPGKAGGGSSAANPQGADWVELMAHEFTHQFNADHTWAGSAGNCTADQFGAMAAYEPGSGSTIVSYSGICNTHDIPNPGNISYYHSRSIEEVNTYITGAGNCNTNTATGNDVPIVSTQTNGCTPNYSIPTRTPFEITGSATDAQQGNLTYTWEQYDLGTQGSPIDAATTTNQPLFRSYFPTASATRTFPSLAIITSGNYNGDAQNAATLSLANWQGEVLPEVARSMKLRLTVRDNFATGGGVENAEVTINVINTGAPFAVTAPNGGETQTAGVAFSTTWNVAGTTGAPISCQNVTIKLSTDGGMTYPTNLGTFPNTGTASVTIPGSVQNSTTARIRVECGTNCFKFFDISNANFTIQGGGTCTAPNITDVAITQPPDCNNLTGSITITASGTSSLQYSVDNGGSWQASNTFPNLAPNSYNIIVRLQNNPTCQTQYDQNPVMINTPMGCTDCITYASTDVPKAIPEMGTITSTINVPATGTLTDVNILNLAGTHAYVGDLTFTLTGPDMTIVSLIAQECGDLTDFQISLDDQAATAIDCPIDDNATEQPAGMLSDFAGKNPAGIWTLTISDNEAPDGGQLTGWSLQLCGNLNTGNCPDNLALDTNPIPNGLQQAAVQITSKGTVTNGSNITFQAGNNIELQADISNQFEVQLGAVFEARIAGCNP